jgi:hypothetical protein
MTEEEKKEFTDYLDKQISKTKSDFAEHIKNNQTVLDKIYAEIRLITHDWKAVARRLDALEHPDLQPSLRAFNKLRAQIYDKETSPTE